MRTKEDATRTGTEMEEAGKHAATFFSRIRNEVIALFAAFTLGRGLKEFIADITKSDIATANAARTLDMSTQRLSAWQEVAKATGGTAEGIRARSRA